MKQRTIPKCGMAASLLGLGCNNFAERSDFHETQAVVHRALDLGITFFDTASTYPLSDHGRSEAFLGQCLGDRRKEVIIATKVGLPFQGHPRRDASRKYITEMVEGCLERLDTDWIDLLQLHFPDPLTPMEETLRAFDDLIRAGKVCYIGCSNHAGWQVIEADWIARTHGLNAYVSAQDRYNVINREAEAELLPALAAKGMGLIPFFPLASGLLTGKYKPDTPPPNASRFAVSPRLAGQFYRDDYLEIVAGLDNFARARGHTLLELALSWLAVQPVVWTIIAGAASPEQLEQNVTCLDWALSPDDMAAIDEIVN
jgi:aryl-alcohol dehydrogenase-like predicted oxidoreductase